MELYTIIAQLINFSVLIFLLNKFLYKPVLKTMDKRRAEIKEKIEETERKLAESDRMKEEYFSKLQEVEKENIVLKEQAINDIKKFKEIELQKAKDEVVAKREKFNEYIELEQKNLIDNFNENLSDLFIEYSNNLLSLLANSTLHTEVLNSFLEKINSLDAAKVEEINKLDSNIIEIISNAVVDDEAKKSIENTLSNKGFKFDSVKYSINESLVLGFELKAGSYVLSWNIKELTANFISATDKKLDMRG